MLSSVRLARANESSTPNNVVRCSTAGIAFTLQYSDQASATVDVATVRHLVEAQLKFGFKQRKSKLRGQKIKAAPAKVYAGAVEVWHSKITRPDCLPRGDRGGRDNLAVQQCRALAEQRPVHAEATFAG